MYRPEGIDQVIWKFAKSDKPIDYKNLREVVADFSGLDLEDALALEDISEREIYNIVATTVANAIAHGGVIKAYMFYDFSQAICPSVFIKNLFANHFEQSLEFRMICGMLDMIRYVKVRDDNEVFIDLD